MIASTMRKLALGLVLVLPLAAAARADDAAVNDDEYRSFPWPHHGLLGTYDRAALQRGFQVFQNVCQACHSLKYLAFRNLTDLGYNEDQVKAIAAQYQVQDGPNDQGEMFERPGLPSDYMPPPYPNAKAAAAANGKAPPDLSLMVKAREGGENYIYSILTGYEDPPAGAQLAEGQHYNKYFGGHVIAMPQPLQPDQVTYEDGTSATLDQEVQDVVQFLSWVAEPKLEERKQMGFKVMLFLVVLTGLLYAYKRKIWSDVHEGPQVGPANLGGRN